MCVVVTQATSTQQAIALPTANNAAIPTAPAIAQTSSSISYSRFMQIALEAANAAVVHKA